MDGDRPPGWTMISGEAEVSGPLPPTVGKIRCRARVFRPWPTILLCAIALSPPSAQRATPDLEALPFAPRRYVSYRASSPISVDGKLGEPSWAAAAWSEAFIDIEGDSRPQPRFRTRPKMLGDAEVCDVST